MFAYATKSGARERRRPIARLRCGFAVLLVLGGTFSLASGVTLLGLVNLIYGILLGITELHRSR
jgi:hypothetical protein